jgi:acetolactate synthase-1/2/3 large subunit
MGYGLPAAIAAKLEHREREVFAVIGDGGFLMSGNELATAMRHGVTIVALVIDNASFGTIRMHQERQYPGRVSGTALVNPDFAALARAMGGFGECVTRTGQFAEVFSRALAHQGPALIELRVDPEALTPGTTLAETRAAAASAQR